MPPNPRMCPYCGYDRPQVVRSTACEWACHDCGTTFVVLRLPEARQAQVKIPAPSPPRTDFIAQAYRGDLKVATALRLAAGLIQQTEAAVKCGGFISWRAPTDNVSPSPVPMLRITA
jgi:hypothetical protein